MTEREALNALVTGISRNRNLVHVADGNASLKEYGVMWINASGTLLAEAQNKDIFIPLDLAALQNALKFNHPDCETCGPFVKADLTSTSLRPSTETSLHGLMPQNVVLHVHCINSIVCSIQQDAESILAPLLQDFNWALVPYVRPGLELLAAIKTVLKPGVNVLILANHGLVVAADTVHEAQILLESVAAALAQPVLRHKKLNLQRLSGIAAGTDYRLPQDKACHSFALERWSCLAASQHVFYPDHAIFLGPTIPLHFGGKPPAIALRGSGVLVHKNAGPAVEPMLRCLSEVFQRLTPKSKLRPLLESEVRALLNWDAETHRQSINPT